jgi:hypothetical protein
MRTAIFEVSGREETKLFAVNLNTDDPQAEHTVYQRLRTLYRRVKLVAVQESFPTYTFDEAMGKGWGADPKRGPVVVR